MSVTALARKHARGEVISELTAYDYTTARLVDEAGVDAILVGDSLAMVMLGHKNTLSLTLDEMLHHIKAVRRGVKSALLVGDLPFMSYQVSTEQALRSAGRLVQEGCVEAVKLEGGADYAATVRAIVRAGIPVQGHIGLTPQRVNVFGGWKVQGQTAQAATGLLTDALALQEAGCFSIVIESVPEQVASFITSKLSVPTIGIGAGPGTSGQVLVLQDLLGMYDGIQPRFVKRYADLGSAVKAAVISYRDEVGARAFPGPEHVYGMSPEEWEQFLKVTESDLPTRP